MDFVKEFLEFLKIRKKYWLLPIIIFLVLFGAVNGELVRKLARKKINKIFPIIAATSTLSLWLVIFFSFSSIFTLYMNWWYQFFYQPVSMLGLGIGIYLSYVRVK